MKLYKHLASAFIALLMGYSSYSQCKINKDEFTGKSTTTATVFLTPANTTYNNIVTLSRVDNTIKINYTLMTPTINRSLKIEDCSLMLKMADNSVLTFTPDETSKISILEGATSSQITTISAMISDQQLKQLASLQLQAIRLAMSGTDGFTIPSINTSKLKDVIKAAACITQ